MLDLTGAYDAESGVGAGVGTLDGVGDRTVGEAIVLVEQGR